MNAPQSSARAANPHVKETTLDLHEGDPVKAGQVIGHLDDDDAQQKIAQFNRAVPKDLDYFTLFEFSAKWDPVPTMLCQNHTRTVKGFMGQTTAFNKKFIKKFWAPFQSSSNSKPSN